MLPLSNPCLSVCVCTLQRVLEAEENGDGFHDDEDFELDTPKRKNRNRGKVSVESKNRIYIWRCVFWILMQYRIQYRKIVTLVQNPNELRLNTTINLKAEYFTSIIGYSKLFFKLVLEEINGWSRVSCVSFQNRGSSRRRAEPVNIEDQDKPYVCDSKGKENFILCTRTILRSVRLQSLCFLRAEILCSPEIWLLREKPRVSIYIYIF